MSDVHDQLRAYGTWVDERFEARSPGMGSSLPRATAAPLVAAVGSPPSGPPPHRDHHRRRASRVAAAVAAAAAVAVVAAVAVGVTTGSGDDPAVETRGPDPMPAPTSEPGDACEPDPYADTTDRGPAIEADLPDGWQLTESRWNRGGSGDRGVGVTWRDDTGRTLEVLAIEVDPSLHHAWMPEGGQRATIAGRPATVQVAMVKPATGPPVSPVSPVVTIGWERYDGTDWLVRMTTTRVEHPEALDLASSLQVEQFLAAQVDCPTIDAPEPGELWTRVGGPGQWVAPGTFSPEVLRAIPAGRVAALPVYADDRSTVVRYLLVAAWDAPNGTTSQQIGDVPAADVEHWRQHVDPVDDRLPPGLDVAALADDVLYPLGRG